MIYVKRETIVMAIENTISSEDFNRDKVTYIIYYGAGAEKDCSDTASYKFV